MKSTSAMATENKKQTLVVEKLKFAFTRKVDTLEKNPEKSRGRLIIVYKKVSFFIHVVFSIHIKSSFPF
jgi:hypothetical protein